MASLGPIELMKMEATLLIRKLYPDKIEGLVHNCSISIASHTEDTAATH